MEEFKVNKLATNHIEITLDLFQEGMDAISNKRYKALLKKIVIAAAVIFALVGLYTYYKGASLFYLICEFVIIALLCVYILVFMPRSARKKNYRGMVQRANGDTPRRTIDFFNDHLVIYAEAGRNTNVGYDEIAEIAETKELWILNCKDNTGVLVSKDGFSMGDFDTVRPVIEKVIEETPKTEKPAPTLQLNAKPSTSGNGGNGSHGSSKPLSLSDIANRSYIHEDEMDDEDEDDASEISDDADIEDADSTENAGDSAAENENMADDSEAVDTENSDDCAISDSENSSDETIDSNHINN